MMGLFNKGYEYLILILLIAIPGWDLSAQVLKINAHFDSTSIVIGDQVKLRLEVDQPKGAKVLFPKFADTITGKIKVIKTFPPDTVQNGGNLHIQQEILVTSFDSGYHKVAPLAFPFQMESIKDTIRSSPLYLNVFNIPIGKDADIRDIKPVYGAPFTLKEIWLYILLGIGAILIAFAAWFLYKKYRNEPVFASKKPIEPAHVIALRELDKLRAEKLWQQNKVKEYYTRLTEIIRVYIEQRFGVMAMEQTSDEILLSLKEVYLEDMLALDLLKKLLVIADLVKFAKSLPLPDENEISLLDAYQFVNNTKLIISPLENEPSDASEPAQLTTGPAKQSFILLPKKIWNKLFRKESINRLKQ